MLLSSVCEMCLHVYCTYMQLAAQYNTLYMTLLLYTDYSLSERWSLTASRPRGNCFTLEETAIKDLSAGTHKVLIASVLCSARILDLHTTQDQTLAFRLLMLALSALHLFS